MGDEQVAQKAVKRRGFGSPETRGPIFVGVLILLLLIGIGAAAYYFLEPSAEVEVKTGRVDATNVRVAADAKTSEAYKEAKRSENDDRYNDAVNAPGGVALPFTFDEDPQGGESGKDITNCDCTIDDEQLMAAIKRLGLGGGDAAAADYMRVAKSDIYIATNGQLMGEDGEALAFRKAPVFMDANGQLLDEKGIALLSKDKEPLYLGKEGELRDRQARSVPLVGELLTATGVVLINDGRLAIRPGNMQRVGRSDIYVTREGQLVTMDGRPIRHSGAYVYQNDERKLINRNGMDVAWEQQAVYQNRKGQLVNVSGKQFQQPGILFSYEGILIDNDGLLTRPLVNIERLGQSDIYKTKAGNLVDGYGLPLTHYSANVRLGPGNKLLTKSGQPARNRKKAEAYLEADGKLRVDVGLGGIQAGILKTSEGVALDREGQMITRRGRLERRGESDIHLTADGLLADGDGKPLLFDKKDTFVDFGAVLPDGSQGLLTYDNIEVKDRYGNRVFLTLTGRLTDANGNAIRDVGVLSSADGVLLTSAGKKVAQKNAMERVVTKDGLPVTYNGKEVFKGEDGRLYDAEGNPILSADGRALFIDENGNVVDETGRIVDDVPLMAGERAVKNGELTTRKQLTTASGERILHDGKEVFVDSSGRLVDQNGDAVLTSDGREVFVDAEGNLVDKNGNRIDEALLQTEAGETVSSGLVAGREQIVTKDGKAVKYQGKDVFKDADGALYDENGNAILTKDGRRVFVDDEGNLVDEAGNLIEEELLTVAGERFVKSGELATRKQLTDASGNPVMVGDKPVFIDDSGRLVDENGNVIKTADGREVFVDKNGNLVDKDGNLITEDLLTAVKTAAYQGEALTSARQLTAADGKPLLYNGKEVYADKDGRLLDEHGNVIKTADGREVFVDEHGNLVDKDGNRITEPLLKDATGKTVSSGIKKGAEKVFTADGKALTYDGKNIFKAADGSLVDAQGNPILTADGKKIFVDAEGRLVDEDGNIVEDPRFETVAKKSVKSGLKGGSEQLTTKDGKAVKYKGKNVFKRADGSLVDENGNAVVTADGRQVYMNEDGQLVDAQGNLVTEDLLSAGNAPVKATELASAPVSEFRKIGNSDLFVARDGTLLDENGRAITYNGKKVRVGKNGQLLDESGNPVVDKNGNPVFINAKGELVDAKGQKIEDSILADGEGVLLGADGKKVTGNIKKIGDSDLYRTEDGKLVDQDGKAIKYNGKDVYVGEDGRLYYENGKPVTDKNGNSVYLDAAGKLVDRNGKAIEGSVLTNANGTLIDSGGQLVTSGGKLTRIPGTDLYRTEDGQAVDKNGKPVLVNGEQVYVDENGRVTNAYGKPIRYKGRDLYLAEDGRLVDRNGQPVLDEQNRAIRLSEDGGLINEDGESITSRQDATGTAAAGARNNGFKKTFDPDEESVTPVNSVSPQEDNETAPPPPPATLGGKKAAAPQGKGGVVLDQPSAERLQRRYMLIKSAMRNQLNDARNMASRNVGYGLVSVGGARNSGVPDASADENESAGSLVAAADGNAPAQKNGDLLQKAGTMLYAVTSYQINSDYIKDVVVDVVGLDPKHPLYNAKAMGKFELAYDRIVLMFEKICPMTGACVDMEGVALDPATSATALASDVDHHYWYRYGGLFLASLLEGTAEAMSESGTREENITPSGTRTTTTGLEGDKLILRSFGKVGERFSEALSDRVNRPPTVWIDPGEEMAIMLFDDIFADAK